MLELRTWKRDDGKAREPGGHKWACLWVAAISGPWYDDSDPDGYGDTEEEAKRDALDRLRGMYAEIGDFLAKCDAEKQQHA